MSTVAQGGNGDGKFDAKALLDRLNPVAVGFAVDALEGNDGVPPERMAERVRKAALASKGRRV